MKRFPGRVLRRCTNQKPNGESFFDDDDWDEAEDDDESDGSDDESCSQLEQDGVCSDDRIEIMVDGHLMLPDGKPDIEELLRYPTKPSVTHWDIVDTRAMIRAIVSGTVVIRLEYVSVSAQQSVHVSHFTIPFHAMLTSSRRIKQINVKEVYRYGELVNSRSVSFVVVLAITAS